MSVRCIQNSNTDDIKDVDEKIGFEIFPNPSLSEIFVSNITTLLDVEIYDIKGQIMTKTQVNPSNSRISLKGLSKGVYIVKILFNNTVYSKKIIVE